jgi:hypothetical protein
VVKAKRVGEGFVEKHGNEVIDMGNKVIREDIVVFTRVKPTNGVEIKREFGFLQTPNQYIKFRDLNSNPSLDHKTWGDFYNSCSEIFFKSLSLWYQNGGDYIYETPHKVIGISPEKLHIFDMEDSSGYVLKPEYPFKENGWEDNPAFDMETVNKSCMDILNADEADKFCFIPDSEFTNHLMIYADNLRELEKCLQGKGKTLLVSPTSYYFESSFVL